jgi:hypothetical protein
MSASEGDEDREAKRFKPSPPDGETFVNEVIAAIKDLIVPTISTTDFTLSVDLIKVSTI